MLILDGTIFSLLSNVAQQLALLFVRHPIPPAWQSEALKKRITKYTEQVRAETAFVAELLNHLRHQETLPQKHRSKRV